MSPPSATLTNFDVCASVLGLTLLASLSIVPLLTDLPPLTWVGGYESPWLEAGSKLSVGLLLGLAVACRTWLDGRADARPAATTFLLVALAGALTGCHYLLVDSEHLGWQQDMYLDILNQRRDAPHQYRTLPYGFTRALEHVTGDWLFACLAYRWFFNYWFVWAWYRFARLFLPSLPALATLSVLVFYYPLSICYYRGQLTDSVSHAFFVLALIYTIQDRWLLLAATLALGVLAKETIILMVPVYWACHWRGGWIAMLKTAVLTSAGVAAFLAARLPLGWRPGAGAMNGVDDLMIATNLGLDRLGWFPAAARTFVPLEMNYLHPLAFVLPFVPFLVWRWRCIDVRLRVMCLTLTPLLLFSNLCFGWMYESRNYVPLLPLLTTLAGMTLLRPRTDGEALTKSE